MSPAPDTAEAIAARRGVEVSRVRDAVRRLEAMGVRLLVTGSLARRSFGPRSDVDRLVTA